MKIVFATNNAHKLAEVQAVLGDAYELVTPRMCGVEEEIPENQPTLEGNASEKSHYLRARTGLDCFADDTGLEVEALDGAPGVYSARYGHKSSDAERIAYLLENLKDVPAERRTAKFVCVITCHWPDGRRIVARGECPGQILFAPKGTGGFGYDPVFVPEGYAETFAEMGAEEKNRISHRARAVQKLCDYLNSK